MNASKICHHPKFSSFCAAFFYRQWTSPAFVRGAVGELWRNRHLSTAPSLDFEGHIKSLAFNAITGLQLRE